MAIEIRTIESTEDAHKLEEIQRRAWDMPDIEIIPGRTMHAIQFNGGLLLGAYDGEELVGFVFGVLGTVQGLHNRIDQVAAARLQLYSTIMGVLPEYRNRSVGYQLKVAQREFALRLGVRLVTWTYDPLESRNGWLNIGKLGAICHRYVRDYHGELGGINAGLNTDRFTRVVGDRQPRARARWPQPPPAELRTAAGRARRADQRGGVERRGAAGAARGLRRERGEHRACGDPGEYPGHQGARPGAGPRLARPHPRALRALLCPPLRRHRLCPAGRRAGRPTYYVLTYRMPERSEAIMRISDRPSHRRCRRAVQTSFALAADAIIVTRTGCRAGRVRTTNDPGYSYETVHTAWHILDFYPGPAGAELDEPGRSRRALPCAPPLSQGVAGAGGWDWRPNATAFFAQSWRPT